MRSDFGPFALCSLFRLVVGRVLFDQGSLLLQDWLLEVPAVVRFLSLERLRASVGSCSLMGPSGTVVLRIVTPFFGVS
jgi:protein gp37